MHFSGGVPQWFSVPSGEIALLRFLFLVTCIFPEDMYLPMSSNLLVLGFFSYLHLISPLCIPREPLSDVCHKPLVWPALGFCIHRCTVIYFGPDFLHLTQCFLRFSFCMTSSVSLCSCVRAPCTIILQCAFSSCRHLGYFQLLTVTRPLSFLCLCELAHFTRVNTQSGTAGCGLDGCCSADAPYSHQH